MKHLTEAYDVPRPGTADYDKLATLLGDIEGSGFLVGFAAGKAAAKLPRDARVVRVVVVAELIYCGGDHCSGLWNLRCDAPEHPASDSAPEGK